MGQRSGSGRRAETIKPNGHMAFGLEKLSSKPDRSNCCIMLCWINRDREELHGGEVHRGADKGRVRHGEGDHAL